MADLLQVLLRQLWLDKAGLLAYRAVCNKAAARSRRRIRGDLS